jgi:trimethylamine---corrinoid protein Co-methyltransferase
MDSLLPMTTLKPEQIEQFRKATVEILEKTGFTVEHEGLLRMARAAGAHVEEASGRVRIPGALLHELAAQIPPRFACRGILGDTWEVGGERQCGTAIVTDPWIIDYETQRPRRPCLEDLRRHTIIAQKLDSVTGISRMDFPITDVGDATSSLRALEVHLLNHAKHNIVLPASLESFHQWLGISEILARRVEARHLISIGIAVASPLTLNGLNGEMLVRSIERGFCVIPTICPMAGSTAPYSLAGVLLQANIETLMVGLLTQMVKPGHPFEYVSGVSVTDMRSGHDLYYTLDKVLWKLASAQLGLSYGLPTGVECGGSLTWRYDQQNGAEGMLFMLAAQASGAHMLSGFGSCHNANGMSGEMMVIQDAWLRAARFLSRGIRTDGLRLGVKSIQEVGPGGQFLTDDLTLQFLRGDEFFKSEIFDFGGGYAEGGSLLERAHDRVEELVAGYESPVPHDIQEDLRRCFHDLYVSMGTAG